MKNKYTISFIFAFLLLSGFSSSMQGQVITFEQIYKTAVDQDGLDVLLSPDGGYIIAGSTVNNIPNDLDIKVLKTDKMGDTLWTKTYADPNLDYPNCMLQTSDNNYFILGYTQISGQGQEIYLQKIDMSGNLLWSKVYGTFGNDDGNQIIATGDGNYAITGGSNNDAYLMKIDPDGNTLWTKYYGGSTTFESTRSVAKCLDGGFILAGQTSAIRYGVAGMFIVRTNSSGDTLWTKIYRGPDSYQGKYILANNDKSYTICMDDSSGARDSDVRVMKIDSAGAIKWNNDFGGSEKDISKMIQPTSDGGYILVGISRSFGWINPYMWLLKFNSGGDTTWSRHFGSYYHNHGYAVRQTPDGGYVSVGHEVSSTSISQIMLVKVDSSGNFTPTTSVEESTLNTAIAIYPNPAFAVITVDLKDINLAPGSTCKILNALGQEVFSESITASGQNERKSIDLKDNDPGIYFLRIQSAKYLITKKFILQ